MGSRKGRDRASLPVLRGDGLVRRIFLPFVPQEIHRPERARRPVHPAARHVRGLGPAAYVSAFLSVIGVGLGQFYNGDTLRGLAFFLGFIAISFNIIATQYQTLLFYGIWLAALAEALWSARRINRYERPFWRGKLPALRDCSGCSALIVALHLVTGEPDLVYLGRVFPLVHLYFRIASP